MASIGAVIASFLVAVQLLAIGLVVVVARVRGRHIDRFAPGATISAISFVGLVFLGTCIWPSYPYDGPHDAIVVLLLCIAFGGSCWLGAIYTWRRPVISAVVAGCFMILVAPVCYGTYLKLRHPIHGTLPATTWRIRWVEHDDFSGIYAYAMRAEVSRATAEELASRLGLVMKEGKLGPIDEVLRSPQWWHTEGIRYVWTRNDMYTNESQVPNGCRTAMGYSAGQLFFLKHCYWM